MGQLQPNNYHWQKIINITPDSFSDGGDFFSSSEIHSAFIKSFHDGVRNFDFGAQSTAPTSLSIDHEVEIKRFTKFFIPFLQAPELPEMASECIFSFDTFRPKTLAYLIDVLADHNIRPKQIFWNDVSGVVDHHSINFLSSVDNGMLVLCHNLCGERELSCNHFKLSYNVESDDFLNALVGFFKERISNVPEELRSKVILDPCFGFSKNSSQNLYLLKNLNEFFLRLGLSNDRLIGISRKRFLRDYSGLDISCCDELDALQVKMLRQFLPKRDKCKYYIRSHRYPFGKK